MTMEKEIACTILEQLGGRMFTLMTGAKDFIATCNGLRFTIGRNGSKANRVEITLNGNDLYDVRFYRYSPARLAVNHRKGTAEWVEEKNETIREFEDIFFDMLQDVFTMATGMYTHF